MTNLTQKTFFGVATHVVRVALFLVVVGAGAAISTATNTASTPDEQVSFTATGTAVITSVTKLPGGLTQLTATTSGKATYLGDVSGPIIRIQDNQGNFGSTAVIVGANGKDSVFLSISGSSEGIKGDKCLIISTGTYTVTGGTGAFANATGSGTIDTLIDQCAGTATGTYTGTISKPNSN